MQGELTLAMRVNDGGDFRVVSRCLMVAARMWRVCESYLWDRKFFSKDSIFGVTNPIGDVIRAPSLSAGGNYVGSEAILKPASCTESHLCDQCILPCLAQIDLG
jgi:hypothetical protein